MNLYNFLITIKLGKLYLIGVFIIFYYPTALFSQVMSKDTSLSASKIAYDKTVDLIYKNAEDAYEFGINAKKEIGEPLDSVNYANLLKVVGSAAQMLGKYEQALIIHRESALVTKKLNLPKSHADCLSNIANVFYYINQYENAIKYIKQSLIYYAQVDSVDAKIAMKYNTLGVIYNETNQKDSAIYYYNKALDLLGGDNLDLALVLGNLGALNDELNNSELALEYHVKSKEIREKFEDFEGLAWTLNHIGKVYLKQGKYVKAKGSFMQALVYATQVGLLYQQKEINKDLFKAFLRLDQIDSAAFYFSEFELLNDSINKESLNKNIQEMEAKYQLEKKEAALALSNEKSARLSAENQTNKLYLSGAIVLLILLAGGFFVVNRSYQQRRKIASMQLELKSNELNEMMSQQEAASLSAMLKGQEEERERIAKDLHDRLGGTLAALKLGMRRAENKVEKEELDMLDGAVIEVRNIAHNLSAGVMEKAGLRVALLELKKMIERSGAIKFDVFVQSNLSEVGQETALELYRIVQELTNNTIKHANATSISVQATMTTTNFNLIFEDNGDGFTQNEISEGMGLRNMRARAEKINGTFHLDSSPGRGTIAIIEIEKST